MSECHSKTFVLPLSLPSQSCLTLGIFFFCRVDLAKEPLSFLMATPPCWLIESQCWVPSLPFVIVHPIKRTKGVVMAHETHG